VPSENNFLITLEKMNVTRYKVADAGVGEANGGNNFRIIVSCVSNSVML